MAYKAYGFFIEGIKVEVSGGMPSIFGAGMITNDGQFVSIGADTHKWIPNIALDFPQFSSNQIDLLTGGLSAGSVKLRLTASEIGATSFLGQSLSRDTYAQFAGDVSPSDNIITFTSSIGLSAGLILYVNEEVIRIDSLISGNEFNVTRGIGQTQAVNHDALSYLYLKPTFWAGRKISIAEFVLPDRISAPVTPTSSRIIWSGFLDSSPVTTKSTSIIELSASSALDVIRNIALNKTPIKRTVAVRPIGASGNQAVQVFTGLEAQTSPLTRVRKADYYDTSGRSLAAFQVSEDDAVVITQQGRIVRGPVLNSKYDTGNLEVRKGFMAELLVISKELDAKLGAPLSPTFLCDYPYHPLTFAACILFSKQTSTTTDFANFDVFAPNWAADISFIADLPAWVAMIEETNYLEIDEIILGWDGEEFSPWDYIVKQLLPAFGFQLTLNANNLIAPIEVGIIDVQDFFFAPQVSPLPEKWDWKPYSSSLLDGMSVDVGERPWGDGEKVIITGEGLRTRQGRITRLLDRKNEDAEWPFFNQGNAENVGLYYAMERLGWRFDGLPSVVFSLDASAHLPYLGEVVRLNRPDGLISDILFNVNGERVNLWGTAQFVCQITSVQLDIKNNIVNVEGLLVLYALGRYAKWRAPAARIKSRTGSGTYLVSGTDSDFNDSQSDALKLSIGDEVFLYTESLGLKSTTATTINSINVSGPDYLITISTEFSSIGVGDDWIVISDSTTYSNDLVIGAGEFYPYVFMTDEPTITRPDASEDDADAFS